MKTTSKIIVAAFLIGFCGLGTRASNFSPVSESGHFSLVSVAACIERSRNEPTKMNAANFSLVRCPEFSACTERSRSEGSAANFSLVSGAVLSSPKGAEPTEIEPTEMSGFALTLTYEQALQILTAAHEQYWYDQITMADLVQRYNDGICTIEKVSEGYQVNGGGGFGTVIVTDFN